MAGTEFVRNALHGLGGVRYDIDHIEEFLDAFGALFDPDNVAVSPFGRSLTRQTWLHNRPVGEVVYHLTGRTREDRLEDLPAQLRVVAGGLDAYDVHLVAARPRPRPRAAPRSFAAPTAATSPRVDSPASCHTRLCRTLSAAKMFGFGAV